jgi:hypothetical protein
MESDTKYKNWTLSLCMAHKMGSSPPESDMNTQALEGTFRSFVKISKKAKDDIGCIEDYSSFTD